MRVLLILSTLLFFSGFVFAEGHTAERDQIQIKLIQSQITKTLSHQVFEPRESEVRLMIAETSFRAPAVITDETYVEGEVEFWIY